MKKLVSSIWAAVLRTQPVGSQRTACVLVEGTNRNLLRRVVAAGGAGAVGEGAPQVGKLEKDRGVGFGEAPLDARPPGSIPARAITAGATSPPLRRSIFRLHGTSKVEEATFLGLLDVFFRNRLGGSRTAMARPAAEGYIAWAN